MKSKPTSTGIGIWRLKNGEKRLRRRLPLLLILLLSFAAVHPAFAVRPFITDDARVVGNDRWQLETSMRIDQRKVQNLNLFAYGVTENFELTVGWMDGYMRQHPYGLSIAGPLLQGKYLFLESKPLSFPGIALAFGVNPPYGTGGLKPDNWSEFAFLCLTETIFDNEGWLWHANIGATVEHLPHKVKATATWGVGTQIRIWDKLCTVQEILSGDPYSSLQTKGGFFQFGFRYLFSDNIQADIEIGSGLWGNPKPDTAVGLGFRMVFGSLLDKKRKPKF
jgi:hypothetical protein